ncbi:hypothetical protein E2C01_035142 [Portunus trituberculatus]|uniref:Uncharacterized protein n=1 Tax=Portunus trituberculatus TaxID=210409 RepID=A0A5B7F8X9_PORTR|nr:hypothetical protein [Portunus trituberculatus]
MYVNRESFVYEIFGTISVVRGKAVWRRRVHHTTITTNTTTYTAGPRVGYLAGELLITTPL